MVAYYCAEQLPATSMVQAAARQGMYGPVTTALYAALQAVQHSPT